MTKKTQVQELYGKEKYNHYLLLAERTPFNKLKLGTLPKKDLLVVVGDMVERYNSVLNENKNLSDGLLLIKEDFETFKNETYLSVESNKCDVPEFTSPDPDEVPEVIKTIDTTASVVKSFNEQRPNRDSGLTGNYPQWN